MPTYEYACQSCGRHLEVYQRFNEPSLTACPTCGGELRKVFHPAGILFKGSGFYKTDSRSSKSSTGQKAGAGASGGGGSTSGGDSSSDGSSTGGSKDSGGGSKDSGGGSKDSPTPSGSKPKEKEKSA